MTDLLIEVGCEELPSSACREIVEQAPRLFSVLLSALGADGATPLELSVAPRRFALQARGLPERLAPPARAVRGPSADAAFGPDGSPTRAAEGFARSQGVDVAELEVRQDNGRRFVYAERREGDRALEDVVPEIAAGVVNGLRFGKTMRWGDGTGLRFSRPVRWIVAKLDERTVPFELHGLVAGEVSRGHRFLGGPAVVGTAADYASALEAAGVIASHVRRRGEITAALDAAAAEAGGAWSDPGGKLEEVLYLVEWPSVIAGRIEPSHMRLPERVLVTAMQSHQRYFPLRDAAGTLMPTFLAVSNGDPAHARVIARGNEEVLDARLQDASFSFDRDREAGLDALDARLDAIVFHQRLGSMADKRDRIVALTEAVAAAAGLEAEDAAAAREAAALAKADQGAVLVAEFSDLQGYVAAQYARLDGRSEAVVEAICSQYLPEGPESPLPATPAGAAVAVADKIDNLVGAFLVDEAPTGSRDPYGLRRAAAGLVRVVIGRGWDVPTRPLLERAARLFADGGAGLVREAGPALDDLEAFIGDRLAFQLAEEGVGAEIAAAAEGARLGAVVATARWAAGLQAARAGGRFARAWTACTRLAKLAAKGPAERQPFASVGDAGEDALAQAVARAGPRIEAAREGRDPEAALVAADEMAGVVDRFFDEVMVNAEDPAVRTRRYALVRDAAETLLRVADFPRVSDGGGAR